MKVTIIGASISGLFTAYLLAKEGVEVEVYEKEEVLGSPPRTLIVTCKINDILDFVPEEAIINRVNYLELFSKSNSARLELRLSSRKEALNLWNFNRPLCRCIDSNIPSVSRSRITLGAKTLLRSIFYSD